MDIKYYTPAIEDLRVGYECEFTTDALAFQVENYDDISVGKLDRLDLHFLITTLYELVCEDELHKHVRTPYLTGEKIMDEGWENIVNEYFSKPPYRVRYNEMEHRLVLTDMFDNIYYIGPCPSINEFRFITKLLGI